MNFILPIGFVLLYFAVVIFLEVLFKVQFNKKNVMWILFALTLFALLLL